MANYVILISGNICAGKSELVRYIVSQETKFSSLMNAWLEESRKLDVVPEFIDPKALKIFYRDREKYSEIFENSCLTGRIVRHLDAKYEPGILVFDRGMIEGAETFSRNSFMDCFLTHEAHERYITNLKRGIDQLGRLRQKSWLESMIVYLEVSDPNILYERQKSRKTPGEEIPLDYLRAINERYGEFFNNIDSIYRGYGVQPPHVIKIDASVDFNEDKNYHKRILEQIVQEVGADLNGK